ncbi:MAG: hypothetical protein ACRD0I_08560 [Acidimicrobiales bacterium]
MPSSNPAPTSTPIQPGLGGGSDPAGPDRFAADRFAAARSVADAVLYEGYVLYPYRASSRKNQTRWQFGVLTPSAFSEADSSERSWTRTECIVEPRPEREGPSSTASSHHVRGATLMVRIRCLHVQHRGVEAVVDGADGAEEFSPVAMLQVEGQSYVEWDEAIDRVVEVGPVALAPGKKDLVQTFFFPGGSKTELVASGGQVVGRVVRTCQPVEGTVRIAVTAADQGSRFLKVITTVENTTDWTGGSTRRDEIMGSCLVAVHTMLAVDGGLFISLLDPPQEAREAVSRCSSDGSYPVLIGEGDVVLSSPIILYDHPEVAPESPGDLYDSTEIDEILALRVLTLTDEEKAEARGTDPRSAAIIDRCDEMTPEMWDRLHGTIRPCDGTASAPLFDSEAPELSGRADILDAAVPWWDPDVDASVDPWSDSVIVGGVEISKGSSVRLRPSHRSDAQDLFLDGLAATVAGVFKDVDGAVQVAVTVDDDPATEELAWQGRYLFFHPDEVEPVSAREPAP